MVGLLLVTHNRIGEELLATARATLGVCPLPSRALAIAGDDDPDLALAKAEELVSALDSGSGVLVITDAYGSTPSNIATRLCRQGRIAVVSGANLPMLLRVLNYPDLPLDELLAKAVTGGQDGVVPVKGEAPSWPAAR